MQKNQAVEKQIDELVQKLTLDEKIGMVHGAGLFRTEGVERLDIPPVKLSDGPMGVRNEFPDDSWIPIGNSDDYITYLPSNSALASTWNRTLAYETGKVLGEEARGRGKDVILGPGINIKRSPLCGRNFEYMSEDPYLSGELAVPLIKGIQESDVAACVKHFAVNNQETERFCVEAIVSDRAMREIYLPAFKKAAEESLSIMGAYTTYKGQYCCENQILLNEILRGEWEYDGMAVSDWGAVHNTREVAEGGLDMEMSVGFNFDEYCMAQPLKKAVEKGDIPEKLLDEKIRNILRMMFRLRMIGEEKEQRKAGCYNTPEHRRSALETARESVILLKNEEKRLPLSREIGRNRRTESPKKDRILVIGDNANRIHSNGGGSAEIKALYEISPLLGIKKLLGGNAQVDFVQGYFADDMDGQNGEISWQADSLENGGGSTAELQKESASLEEKRRILREEAVRKAAEYETVIMIGGQNHLQDLEGQDRASMKLPYGQDKLIEDVLDANSSTILVIVSGSAVEMPWIHKAKTLVWQWYAGMEGGTALAEVLFGEINPSGRLPETFPRTHMDCLAHCIGEFANGKTVAYTEDIFVGYRYYDTEEVDVLFPFGYGLSYTEFDISEFRAVQAAAIESHEIKVHVKVTNTGENAGKEVVQIYIGKPESEVKRPKKVLAAFEKVELGAGESCELELSLDPMAMMYYDEEKQKFILEPGTYRIYAGKSISDICMTTECEIKG